MKRFGVLVWWAILAVSVGALVGGFGSGRSMSVAAAPATHDVQRVPVAPAVFAPLNAGPQRPERTLFGAHSLTDATDEERLPDGVAIAVERPGAAGALENRARAEGSASGKLAIVVYGAGHSSALDVRFADLPMALTFAVDADGEDVADFASRVGASGKGLVVTIPARLNARAQPAELERWCTRVEKLHATGVVSRLNQAPSGAAARAIVAAMRGRGVVLDAMGNDEPALYHAARVAHVQATTRDVLLDAFDDDAYVAFMVREARELALRTGSAVAFARPTLATYRALAAAAPAFKHSGVELVGVESLAR